MQATSPKSARIPLSSIAPPTENTPCCSRTIKIALAIFAALTTFVFLPFGTAITLSAVVTLGTIFCSPSTESNEKPQSATLSSTPSQTSSSSAPYEVVVILGNDNSISTSNTVCITFQTPKAKQEFVATHREKFQEFANLCNIGGPSSPCIRIAIKPAAYQKGINSTNIVQSLNEIFGMTAIMNVTKNDDSRELSRALAANF